MENTSKKHISKAIQILLKAKRPICLFISLFFLTTSNACAMNLNFFNKNKLPTTPYALPIDISKKGNKAEIDLRIKSDKERKDLEPKSIAFELKFFWHDPRRSEAFRKMIGWVKIDNFFALTAFEVAIYPIYWVMEGRKYDKVYTKEEKNEIWKDNERLAKLLGGGIWVDDGTKYGKRIDHPAVLIPSIHITITNLDDPDKKIVYDKVLEVKKHPSIGGYFYKYLDRINLDPGNYKIIAEVQSDALDFKGTEVKIIIGSYRAKV